MQLDTIIAIIRYYLSLLSVNGVNLLLDICKEKAGEDYRAKKIIGSFELNEDKLLELIYNMCDEEDRIMYLNIYLWKQKIEYWPIKDSLKISIDILFDAWLIHRQMFELGYTYIFTEPRILDDECTSYEAEIEKYLGFHRNQNNYFDDDYFSGLIIILNILGSKIKNFHRITEVYEFVDYICINYINDKRIKWLGLSEFSLLIYDLQYSIRKSWPVYKYFLPSPDRGIFDYVSFITGIRLYGDKARNELKKIKIPGGFELLDYLASN